MDTTASYDPLLGDCPTRQVLTRIADKWSMLVVLALTPGTMRFSQVRRRVEGVTQKMLTQTLRGLERDGLVVRAAVATVPVTVTYTLTPLGADLAAAVDHLRRWATGHIVEVELARERFDEVARIATPPRPVSSPLQVLQQ